MSYNTEDQLIKHMAEALHYYRSVWLNPKEFALNSLLKDRGKIATEALDMWEIFCDVE